MFGLIVFISVYLFFPMYAKDGLEHYQGAENAAEQLLDWQDYEIYTMRVCRLDATGFVQFAPDSVVNFFRQVSANLVTPVEYLEYISTLDCNYLHVLHEYFPSNWVSHEEIPELIELFDSRTVAPTVVSCSLGRVNREKAFDRLHSTVGIEARRILMGHMWQQYPPNARYLYTTDSVLSWYKGLEID